MLSFMINYKQVFLMFKRKKGNYVYILLHTYDFHSKIFDHIGGYWAVMWIRIDRIRIHKIWSMRIRINDKNHSIYFDPSFKVEKKKNIFNYKKTQKFVG